MCQMKNLQPSPTARFRTEQLQTWPMPSPSQPPRITLVRQAPEQRLIERQHAHPPPHSTAALVHSPRGVGAQ